MIEKFNGSTIAQTTQQSRAWWERNRKRSTVKGTLPEFEVMLEKFRNDCLDFGGIAEELGVTTERVRQIYMRYFSKIIPRRPNGRVRRRVCTLRKLSKQIRESFKTDPEFATLFARTLSEGIPVEPVRVPSGRTYSARLIKAGGYICVLYSDEEPDLIVRHEYWKFNVTPCLEAAFFILQAGMGEEAHFLIVPGSCVVSKRRSIYVPAELKYTGRTNSRPIKHNWLQYLEAWHLLKAPPATAADEPKG